MDERYDRSADMRLLELQREALGVPRRVIGSTSYSDPDPLGDIGHDDVDTHVEGGAIVIAAIDAQPRSSLIAGAVVTVSLSVANDGNVPARGVRISFPLPADTTYRAGTLRLDEEPGTDAAASELFADGVVIGDIAPGVRRTILVKLAIEAGLKDIILSPHLRAASGAVLGLRAMRLTRGMPARPDVIERPFYESDEHENALESIVPPASTPTITVLQPREVPPPPASTRKAEPSVQPKPVAPSVRALVTRIVHDPSFKELASKEPALKEPALKEPAFKEPAAPRPVPPIAVEPLTTQAAAPATSPPARPEVIPTPDPVESRAVEPVIAAVPETLVTPSSQPVVTVAPEPVLPVIPEPIATLVSTPISISAAQAEPIVPVAFGTLPKAAKPPIEPKSKPRPRTKAKPKPPVESAQRDVAVNDLSAKSSAEEPALSVRTEVAAKVEVVRSAETGISVAGRGGPVLTVRIDRKRLATLTGLFSGASLGMIAHYLVLNALAAKDPLADAGTDTSIAAFVTHQEQLLLRALVTTRLGKTPPPDSLSATLPAWPPALSTLTDRRDIAAASAGQALLAKAFQPTDMAFLQRSLSNDKTAPFLRAAQLFVGLCANDAIIADDRERRHAGVALTAYAALATAEISRIFLRAKLHRAPVIFAPTEKSFDEAAKTVLAALARSIT